MIGDCRAQVSRVRPTASYPELPPWSTRALASGPRSLNTQRRSRSASTYSGTSPYARTASRPSSSRSDLRGDPSTEGGEGTNDGSPPARRVGDAEVLDRQPELLVRLSCAAGSLRTRPSPAATPHMRSAGSCSRVHASATRTRPPARRPAQRRRRAWQTPRKVERHRRDVHRMRLADVVLLTRGNELLDGVVAHGLGDGVAHAVLAAVRALDERRIDEAAQRLERVDGPALAFDLGHRLDGLQRRRAGEGGEAASSVCSAGLEQRVRPVQRRSQAAMAIGEVARAACEHACERSSRASSSAGATVDTRAAASSTASGMPSIRGADRRDRLRVVARVVVGRGRGRRAGGRAAAALWGVERSRAAALAHARGATGADWSPARSSSASLEQQLHRRRGVHQLLEVVEHAGASGARRSRRGDRGVERAPVVFDAERRGDGREEGLGSRTPASDTSQTPPSNAESSPSAAADGEPCLSGTAQARRR